LQLALFSRAEAQRLRYTIFLQSDLGRLHQALPLQALADLLPEGSGLGAPGWFDNSGKIALQFLKAYTGLSDRALLERLNTDWAFQLFCGIQLREEQCIRDENLIWRTRKQVAFHLELSTVQECLLEHWKQWINQIHLGQCDATCYESYIKYPTDVKLLWDCCEWVHRQIKAICRAVKVRRPRSKIKEQRAKQLKYAKRKRKPRKLERRRRKALLYLLNKLMGQLLELMAQQQPSATIVTTAFTERLKVVQRIYQQQQFHYDNPKESVPQRIVSLFKPYLRPIVRGKENKRVEFGAKAHIWQVDGINFVEHLNFEAFHEGNRLPQSIAFHQKHFGKLRQLGADRIYATNANRTQCSKLGITTCFPRKGRPVQDQTLRQQQQKARKAIGTVRATVLEGSFGNEKNHYGLRKIPARTQATEKLWIFFGIHTANAVRIAKRMANSPPAAAVA